MRKMNDHQTKNHMLINLAILTTDVNFAYWLLLQFLLSPNAYLKDGVWKLVFLFAKDPVLALQLKMFDIAQWWAQKVAKHKQLLNLMGIV